jgi:hypothetical protein
MSLFIRGKVLVPTTRNWVVISTFKIQEGFPETSETPYISKPHALYETNKSKVVPVHKHHAMICGGTDVMLRTLTTTLTQVC